MNEYLKVLLREDQSNWSMVSVGVGRKEWNYILVESMSRQLC